MIAGRGVEPVTVYQGAVDVAEKSYDLGMEESGVSVVRAVVYGWMRVSQDSCSRHLKRRIGLLAADRVLTS